MAKNLIPLERDEALTLVSYLRVKGYTFHHSPNDTGHTQEAMRRAVRMKREGTSAGFPDYTIVINGKLLFVELKRVRGGVVSPEQREWLRVLSTTGAHAIIAHGSQEAIEYIEQNM